LSTNIALPILKELVPTGLEYGTVLLVEFAPDSLWYETSFTVTAQALRAGIITEYHTFLRTPAYVRGTLTRLGLDVANLEAAKTLTINDSYSDQTDLKSRTLDFMDFDEDVEYAKRIKAGYAEEKKRHLHIDDNTGILLQYNKEKEMVDQWRTRIIPSFRAREALAFNSLLTGTASDAFYRQLESLCDGIIDFKSEEKGGNIQNFLRVRMMRGQPHDSQWHRLEVLNNGEVTLAE
jgi:KaiC/GvpD/RAD55 family RecA-like ATPase